MQFWTALAKLACLIVMLVATGSQGLAAEPAQLPANHPADGIWKAGVARVVITPEELIWMAGYGARTRPAEGRLQHLDVERDHQRHQPQRPRGP